MYKTYMYTVILYLMTMTNASISGKPATDLKTMQSRLIQWVIYTDQCQQPIKEHVAHIIEMPWPGTHIELIAMATYFNLMCSCTLLLLMMIDCGKFTSH